MEISFLYLNFWRIKAMIFKCVQFEKCYLIDERDPFKKFYFGKLCARALPLPPGSIPDVFKNIHLIFK